MDKEQAGPMQEACSSTQTVQAELLRLAAGLKQEIQMACDAAFMQLRARERLLLRAVDAVGHQLQEQLSTGSNAGQQGHHQPSSLLLPMQMSLCLDTELLERAIDQFATVRLSPAQKAPSREDRGTSPAAPWPAQRPKIDPADPARWSPQSGRGPLQLDVADSAKAMSVTSSDIEDKFEFIEDSSVEVLSLPDHTDWGDYSPYATLDAESRHWTECRGSGPHGDCASGTGPSHAPRVVTPHPMADGLQGWLLPARHGNRSGERDLPSPAAQWSAAMETAPDLLWRLPAGRQPTPPARGRQPAPPPETGSGWLLRPVRRADEPDRPAACAARDWRSGWLLPAAAAGDRRPGEAAGRPDLLEPYREMARHVRWLAAR